MDLFAVIDEKAPSEQRAILLAQARMRAVLVPVVVLAQLLLLGVPAAVSATTFACVVASYALYFSLPFVFGERVAARTLLVATAIIDPLMLSLWIAISGTFGSIVAGFYIFTTLGFGFRAGTGLLYLCQAVSIAGFTAVLATSAFWRENPMLWLALLIPLIVVPFYSASLIRSLHVARRQAEQDSHAKSDLLAKVSHELRTPLTGIVATAELIANTTQDTAVRQRTQSILRLSDNLLGEINDLLDEAKYDAGSLELVVAPFELAHKVDLLHSTFEAMAARNGVTFESHLDPQIEGPVAGDAHCLNRVLLNLCGNAVKFTEKGHVRLTLQCLDESIDNLRVRFVVSDTGIGIPAAYQQRIFEPFVQVPQGTQRRYGGTGLGLALARKSVQRMGGTLQMHSVPGSGSRFWFDLDLPRVQPLVAVAEPAALPIAPKRILLAEDNDTNLILIHEMLQLDGHAVTTCANGVQALEALATSEFDLVMLDYNLGDMDGVRVIHTYRFGRLQTAPVVFLTADATTQTASRIREAGAAAVIYKPVTLSSLRQAIAQVEFPPSAAEVAAAPPAARPDRPSLKVVEVAPIDAGMLEELRSVSRRPGFMAELLAQARTDIRRAADQLRDALLQRDVSAVAGIAHTLKGVAGNVGAVRVAALAAALMNMTAEQFDASRERSIGDLQQAVNEALDALRRVADAETGSGGEAGAGTLHLD